MSDFCKQCSIDMFGEDSGDMRGITKPEDYAKGMSCIVLCEDCGPIQVDPDGNCISIDCLKLHGNAEKKLKDGCCSAITPCAFQRQYPGAICRTCIKANEKPGELPRPANIDRSAIIE